MSRRCSTSCRCSPCCRSRCAYNLWPVSKAKWVLRRFDHAAIYLLIAGTYTPFLAQLDDRGRPDDAAIVWCAAIAGMAVKLFLPGRFDRLAVVFYLAIGWSGVVSCGRCSNLAALDPLADRRGRHRLFAGVVFFAWQSLRFQSALWHGFRRRRRSPASRRRHGLPGDRPRLSTAVQRLQAARLSFWSQFRLESRPVPPAGHGFEARMAFLRIFGSESRSE